MSARVDFAYLRAVRSPTTGPRSAAAVAVASLLALRADNGVCYLDRETIGEETRLGARTVRRACRELTEGGWVTEEHRPGQPKWTLQIPSVVAPEVTRKAQAERREKPRLAVGERREKLKLSDAKSPGWGREKPRLLLSGSTPKKPQVDLPQQISDPGSSEKLIQPESGSPREVTRGQVALPGLAEVVKPTDPLEAPEVVEVLEHWRSRGYHTRKPIDSPERRKRIAARLAEGFDVGALKAAIDGARLDPWLMGTDARSAGKRYLGVETILRDAAQVERLAGLWDVAVAEGRERADESAPWVPPPPPPKSAAELAEVAKAKAEALAKLKETSARFTPPKLEAASRPTGAELEALLEGLSPAQREKFLAVNERARASVH